MTKLYWVGGPWTGKLALASRPRGGDWLADEVRDWHKADVNTVLSLLTPDEEKSLDLQNEAQEVRAHGMDFLSLPIADREVPTSETQVVSALEQANSILSIGKNVVIHCRQGVGRSGLIAACLLVSRGLDPSAAVDRISIARGVTVPETVEQRRWIDRYAASLTSAK